jgi:predicted nuclease of predicted toxin-antitoxin system
MTLLIDENVPRSVTDFFRERGHDVQLVTDLLAAGTPDPVVATAAEEISAIVVTWNHKDFKKLVSRIPSTVKNRRLVKAGRITFRCHEAKGRKRIEEEIASIEFEYQQSITRGDQRLMVEIGDSQLKFIR